MEHKKLTDSRIQTREDSGSGLEAETVLLFSGLPEPNITQKLY